MGPSDPVCDEELRGDAKFVCGKAKELPGRSSSIGERARDGAPWYTAPKMLVPGTAHSGSTQLERRQATERAWRAYAFDGLAPGNVGEPIRRSWQRSRECYGIDPSTLQPTSVDLLDGLELRSRRDEVLSIAAPILRDFSDRLSLSDHVLSYFDAEGWMLWIDGDARIVEQLRSIRFQPGTNWAERSAGTNGPGTSLATAEPLEVFASEHYVEAWQAWSCAAAPIMLPGSSAPLGVVDITGPWEVRRRQALVVVKAIARAIQERLRAASSVRQEVVRYAFRAARESGDALVAVDLKGRVIAANAAASRQRLVEAGGLRHGMDGLLSEALGGQLVGDRDEVLLQAPCGSIVAAAVRHEGSLIGALLRMHEGESPKRARQATASPVRYDFGRILGQSSSLQKAVRLARSAANHELPVLVSGESGTGKELFAQSIHGSSKRARGPFVPVNCGSIPAELVEAELFGYEAGAFTGARREGSPGRIAAADGGTLFLDEVSELPAAAQTALLRVLQEREVVRLGGCAPRAIDVRVIAASNKPLEEQIRAGRFRSDLFYRLNVLPISIPPLRERRGDVALLARAFLDEARIELGRDALDLAPDALEALEVQRWPGNIRELRNVILRAAAMTEGCAIARADLLFDSVEPAPASPPPAAPRVRDVRSVEREAVVDAIAACHGNLASAARQLGISRMTLYRWISRYGISR